MRTLHRAFAAAVAALTLFCIAPASGADVPYRVSATSRIKDLANIEGVRQNQLIGYGLVVGLNGTGDTLNNIPFTKQSLQAMLERLGVNIRGATIRARPGTFLTTRATRERRQVCKRSSCAGSAASTIRFSGGWSRSNPQHRSSFTEGNEVNEEAGG